MSYSETPIHRRLLVSLTSICILLLFRLALTQFAGHICILFFKNGNKCVVCSCAFNRQFIVTQHIMLTLLKDIHLTWQLILQAK